MLCVRAMCGSSSSVIVLISCIRRRLILNSPPLQSSSLRWRVCCFLLVTATFTLNVRMNLHLDISLNWTAYMALFATFWHWHNLDRLLVSLPRGRTSRHRQLMSSTSAFLNTTYCVGRCHSFFNLQVLPSVAPSQCWWFPGWPPVTWILPPRNLDAIWCWWPGSTLTSNSCVILNVLVLVKMACRLVIWPMVRWWMSSCERRYQLKRTCCLTRRSNYCFNHYCEWYASQCSYYSLLRWKRMTFWQTKIDAEHLMPCQLWKSIDKLMGRGSVPVSFFIGPMEFHCFFMQKLPVCTCQLLKHCFCHL